MLVGLVMLMPACSMLSANSKDATFYCPEVVLSECDPLRDAVPGERFDDLVVDYKLDYKYCALLNKAKLQCIEDHNKRVNQK